MGYHYEINYVCFPCRRNARKGESMRAKSGNSSWSVQPVPTCPSCGHKMLGWNGRVPGSEKEWVRLERKLIDRYHSENEWCERFNFNIHSIERRYENDYGRGMRGNPCALRSSPRWHRQNRG